MSKPAITLAFDEHRNREVVSLRFVKEFAPGLSHESSKITDIYTHFSNQSLACLAARLAKIQSSLDRF